MNVQMIPLIKRSELNEAIRIQYNLNDEYDCWDVLFGKTDTYVPYKVAVDLKEELEEIKETSEMFYSEEMQNSINTLQYLVDCGYDKVVIKY